MPRRARVVIPGVPHHITQRGNDRQVVFLAAEDRHLYLRLLRDRCSRYGVDVLGYSLMTNHVHLIGVPKAADSLAKGIGGTSEQYAMKFNEANDRSGHLWQERFGSTPMDDVHTVVAMRYVEQNPERAGMVASAVAYPWSSAAAHCGAEDPSGLLDLAAWARRYPPAIWAQMLRERVGAPVLDDIRRRTRVGCPFGSEDFVRDIEAREGRTLRLRPAGRPRRGQ